jgi:indoleamine 2,3-dioxygenase
MPRNPRFINLFSRTEDEENFYIASAQAEIVGVEALHVLHAHAARSNIHDEDSVCELAAGLDRIADMIEDISTTIQSVRGAVNPRIFYDEVRPWYVGSTAERPWIYDGVEETKLELDGPSAGQSAIMHMLDVFLDINHAAPTRSMPSHVQRGPVSGGFMERMRRYMPGSQRDFLEHLAVSQHPVRELARVHPELLGPYNRAVRALTRLRDHHIRIATLYIVSMAKSAPVCPFMRGAARSAAATRAASAPAKGTGGNEVSLLLKAGRDATKRAILEA